MSARSLPENGLGMQARAALTDRRKAMPLHESFGLCKISANFIKPGSLPGQVNLVAKGDHFYATCDTQVIANGSF
jgi:hypothetical protein